MTDPGRSGDPVELERVRAELADSRRAEAELLREVAERERELDRQRQDYTKLSDRAAADREAIGALQAQVAQVNTTSWQLFNALRQRLIALSGGQGSFGNRAVRKALRTALAARHGRQQPPPIELPEFSAPEVSLVISLYSRADLTREALESIRDETHRVPYEVILVDDTADADTKALLATVRGARIITNETNLGYLRSVNRGAAAARGQWLVLCNNDIKFLYGWVGAMLECAYSAPDVGVVTPKYLYPDLVLNEAGGVIWSDGTGGNYGRGEDPSESRFEYRREVDYGSAAALMVRADFWRAMGGYDERYIPMYYEDTDLCFAAREHGLRVLYEPRANVVHFEGASAGTDLSSGHKRYQEINRVKFVDKWRERLEREQLPPAAENVRRAADRHRGPRVLILDHRVPMPDRDSGSLRLRAMISALSDLGCRVTVFPEDLHMVLPYTLELMSAGIEVFYGDVNAPERSGRDRHVGAHSDHPRPAARGVRRAGRGQPAARGPGPARGLAGGDPGRRQGGLPARRDLADPDHRPGGPERRRQGPHVRRQGDRGHARGDLGDRPPPDDPTGLQRGARDHSGDDRQGDLGHRRVPAV